MNIHQLLKVVITCSLCFACRERQYNDKLQPLSLNDAANNQRPTNVTGDWVREYFLATYELSLLPNGVFKFQEHGCTGTCYSEGIWKQNGSEITLQSDNKYNSSFIDSLKHNFVRVSKSKNSNKIYYIDSEMLNHPIVLRSDSTTVYFSNKKLILKDESLVEIDSSDSESTWIYKKKNNR